MYTAWRLTIGILICAAGFCQALIVEASPIAFLDSGCNQMRRGNYDYAIKFFIAAIKQNPSDLQARRLLADALIAAGRGKEAIQQLNIVSTAEPEKAIDLCAKAEAYSQLGENKIALRLYKKALLADCQSNKARIGLARTLLIAGEFKSASAVCYDTVRFTTDRQVKTQCLELLDIINTRQSFKPAESNS